jgi:hypothetical protein
LGHFDWSYGRALEINQEEVKRFRVDFAEVGPFTEDEETYVVYKGRSHPL